MATLIQQGKWTGWSDADAAIHVGEQCAAAILTAARDYMAQTGRAMPEFVEPVGGLRSVDQVKAMQRAFDSRNADQLAFFNMSTTSTARPSLSSAHITGMAIDVATAAFHSWLLENGRNYGLKQTLAAFGDPRHWEFIPGLATAALSVMSLLDIGIAGSPARPQGDTMLVRNTARGDYILEIGKVTHSANPGVFDRIETSGGSTVHIVDADIDAVMKAFGGPSWTPATGYPPPGESWFAPELVASVAAAWKPDADFIAKLAAAINDDALQRDA